MQMEIFLDFQTCSLDRYAFDWNRYAGNAEWCLHDFGAYKTLYHRGNNKHYENTVSGTNWISLKNIHEIIGINAISIERKQKLILITTATAQNRLAIYNIVCAANAHIQILLNFFFKSNRIYANAKMHCSVDN